MPLWLQTQLSYTATEAGKVMAPVGIFAILLSPIIGKILPKVDARRVASLAFWDLHWFFPQSSLQHGSRYDVADDSNADSGAAMSMFFIPLTSIILSGQPPEKFRSIRPVQLCPDYVRRYAPQL
jgi:DHA2 family multidrug resistance protein